MPAATHDAAKSEALDESLTITWRKLKFTVPANIDWPVSALEAFEDGHMVGALRALLGPDQWAQFRESTPAPTSKDLGVLSGSIASAAGFGTPGE